MYLKYKNSAGTLFKARKEAAADNPQLESRESACEFFSISAETLKCYETGILPVPEDFVFRAMEVYDNQFLLTDCFNETRTGQFIKEKYGFSVQRDDLRGATLGLVNEFTEIYEEQLKKFVKLASDGAIDKPERPSAEKFATELSRVIESSAKIIYLTRYAEKSKTAVQAAACR